jgi:hypothetical protein
VDGDWLHGGGGEEGVLPEGVLATVGDQQLQVHCHQVLLETAEVGQSGRVIALLLLLLAVVLLFLHQVHRHATATEDWPHLCLPIIRIEVDHSRPCC